MVGFGVFFECFFWGLYIWFYVDDVIDVICYFGVEFDDKVDCLFFVFWDGF